MATSITTSPIPVKYLKLDLTNFRTVRQADEHHAIAAMIAISPDRFWALMNSLIDDGFHPTENVIVLNDGTSNIVKEGNRRVAALKLIHGHISTNGLNVTADVLAKIASMPAQWKLDNADVPCAIYDVSQASQVDRIVRLTHGKGEKAGRDQWNAIARARHNRDSNNVSEPALDLLEKYLKEGQNLMPDQKSRWAGSYPLSVLEEAAKKLAPRLGVTNASDLAGKYPTITHRTELEKVLLDIGSEVLGFKGIRNTLPSEEFGTLYGIPAASTSPAVTPSTPTPSASTTSSSTTLSPSASASPSSGTSSSTTTTSTGGAGTTVTPVIPVLNPSASIQDPKAVKHALTTFVPAGHRPKVVSLRNEAVNLNIKKNPLAFCFILRSMFEISAKEYCAANPGAGIQILQPNGNDKPLMTLLRDIANYLISPPGSTAPDRAMQRLLHGPMAELGRHEGLLSVTSMNQLVHNTSFSLTPSDICTVFANVFPLLKELNK